jgi:hypothetical protein
VDTLWREAHGRAGSPELWSRWDSLPEPWPYHHGTTPALLAVLAVGTPFFEKTVEAGLSKIVEALELR